MQFVQRGPDIPDELLRAHEDGDVVFFCGAGISYPAGLPGFAGLVDQIYTALGAAKSDIEQDACNRSQFDAALDLLERRLPGGRLSVRRALASSLTPNLRRKGAADTHAALLTLSRCSDGSTRIVTTNFDRIFEREIRRTRRAVPSCPAPALPIPKKARWNGIVYLHGLLPETLNESDLNRLIVTSGDFGLAYLIERWAARFVSELFRNYTVCFVGYSLNDPVLRYMMDALAADKMLGEWTPQAFAFGDCNPGRESEKQIEWEAKGVQPILYEVPLGTHDHSALHRTLKAWADTYRDGVQGKERIVVDYAATRPSATTKEDDFVGRMLWALADPSGLPARRFAEFDPAPSLEWLSALEEQRFGHKDLLQFGVTPSRTADPKLEFSVVGRPTPYDRAPWMRLSSRSAETSLDPVMFHIAKWITRHLNDPKALLWLVGKGWLHPRLAWLVAHAIDEIEKAEVAGDAIKLADLRARSPNAIPSLKMRLLWRLQLAGRVRGV